MDFEKSSIERLKRTLYSRNEKVVPKEKRTPVQSHGENKVPTDWGDAPTFNTLPVEMAQRNNTFFNKFLLGSFIFFVVALAVALFIFFGGINMISSNNLDIQINAPSSTSSGEELLVNLSIVNTNRTDLEDTSLFITYPDGSQAVGVTNKTLSHETIALGTIVKGGTKDYSVRSILSGEKDSVKTFTFRIEYKVKGSNAVFSKEKTYDVIIGSSPIFLDVSYPPEVNSGQLVTLSIDITSNSSAVITNPLVKIEYPYGFTYKSSNLPPLRDNSVWSLGDLKNGDKKNLVVTGILVGQNLEDRSFRVSAGTPTLTNSKDFDTPLVAYLATIGIRKSFFDLQAGTSDVVARLGQNTPVVIKWQNTLPDKIVNAHLEATISGNVFNRSSVSVSDGGFYRSLDNTVIWDKSGVSNLQSIMPGDSGQIRFSVGSLDNSPQTRSIKNPHIDVHVVMTGDRIGAESGVVTSSEDYTIKISSNPTLIAKSTRSSGPFTNTGAIPPRADKESTYTITWTLTNTSNDLSNTTVSAVLPPGVAWKEETSPTTERVVYNPDTRTVSWNVGNVAAGTGFSSSPREVSFKVGLTPSLSQVGSPVDLIGESSLEATDTYTTFRLQVGFSSVNTHFSDLTFKSGNEIVIK
jgi:hypothetical protein